MSSPVPQTITLLDAAPMQTSTPSARIDSKNYQSGMIAALWVGNDFLDATLTLQGSFNGDDWGNMGAQIDDVGSVTISTADDNQQWAFPQGFPFPYLRLVYDAGSNSAGSLTIYFLGFIKAPGS